MKRGHRVQIGMLEFFQIFSWLGKKSKVALKSGPPFD
jgi:hypothetical protein